MAFVPIYILILGFTIVIDYFAGIYIEEAEGKKRRLFLVCSIIANISVLVVFKYYNFINENLSFLLKGFALNNPIPYLSILLPIGLSFHTFQAMSYTIEVYRGNQKAERHFGIYSLYVMFYPQLIAGPIERPQNLLHQFREKYDFDYDRVTSGLRLMAWGLFKKVVIADRLAIVADTIYNDPMPHNSLSLAVGAVFFSFQIFCDFSGYTDMALGAARIMGFTLMKNFNRPFSAKSVSELWRRWHISLSTWFADYFYNPIAVKRRDWGNWSIVYASMVTFLVLGLWHGANWTFIVFGVLQGFILSFEFLTKKIRKKIRKKLPDAFNNIVGTIYTFSYFVFSCIFFRAESVHDAFQFIAKLFGGIPDLFYKLFHHQSVIEYIGLSPKDLVLCFGLIGVLETMHFIQGRKNISQLFMQKPTYFRWAVYYGVIITVVFWGVFENRQFIYFQF